MKTSEKGYVVGKQYGTVSDILLLAWFSFATAAMIAAIITISRFVPHAASLSVGDRIGMSVCAAIAMGVGVWLTGIHNTLPNAKYTVVDTYTNGADDGYYKADIVYTDGTTKTLDVEISPNGFWKDLGSVITHMLAGK